MATPASWSSLRISKLTAVALRNTQCPKIVTVIVSTSFRPTLMSPNTYSKYQRLLSLHGLDNKDIRHVADDHSNAISTEEFADIHI